MDVKCSLEGEGGGLGGGGVEGQAAGRLIDPRDCWAADAASAHSGACALGQRNWNIVSHPRQGNWASCAIIGGGTEHLASSMCENWTPCAIHDKEKWASCAIIGARTEHLALSRCVNWTSCAIQVWGLNILKVHKIEIFFGFDFEICIISLLVMWKYKDFTKKIFGSGHYWGRYDFSA
jgi:hypothetical protein